MGELTRAGPGAEEAAFLERSLDDLDREHDAGDLDDADYGRLRDEYRLRLAGGSTSARRVRPQAPTSRLVATVACVTLVAAVGGVLLARSVGERTAGATFTGNAQSGSPPASPATAVTTTVTTDQRTGVAACVAFEEESSSRALDCYLGYTDANPGDPAGFTAFGLFTIRQGLALRSDQLVDSAEGFLAEAVRLDPTFAEARAYRAFLYARTDRPDLAREELDALDALDPPAELAAFVAPLRAELGGGDDDDEPVLDPG